MGNDVRVIVKENAKVSREECWMDREIENWVGWHRGGIAFHPLRVHSLGRS